ncbi:hypothetical protein ACIGW5_09675 [Streptomyces prasinus]
MSTPKLVDAAVAEHGWGEPRRRLLPARSGRDRLRAIKKPMRWPIMRSLR